jgi:hypothetical protein
VQKRSLSTNDTHHAALNKEPEVSQSSLVRLVMKQLNEPDNDMIFIFMELLEFHGSRARLNERNFIA